MKCAARDDFSCSEGDKDVNKKKNRYKVHREIDRIGEGGSKIILTSIQGADLKSIKNDFIDIFVFLLTILF